jgi:hypothetical protein
MFLDELTGLRKSLGSRQQECQSIRRIQLVEELLEKSSLAVVMHMHIDKLRRTGLREN